MLKSSRCRALLCAGAIATSLMSAVPPAFAQAVSAEKSRAFAIPAGPLAAALNTFASESGLALVCPAELTRGRRTEGLSGSYTSRLALARLLTGTNLIYRFTDASTVVIEEAPAKPTEQRVLGPVRVEGAENHAAVNGINGSRDITATEGTGSYTSGAVTVGSKVPQSMKETTQAVSVITAQRMEEQNITDFSDAMDRATGVTLLQGDTNVQYNFYSRGFAINSIQIDGGAPLATSDVFYPQIDMAMYDHVELLRGATGLLNGYGDPSGSVNLVRKKPLSRRQVTLETQMGSWSNYRAVVDATAPLGFDGKLRGRAVVTYQQNEHFYDVASDDKTLIYGILDYDLAPSTVVNAGMSFARQDSVPWMYGLPRYLNGDDLHLPRSVALAFPWNRWDFDTTEIFAGAEQRLGSDWTLKLNVTHNRQESSRKLGSSNGTVTPVTNAGPRIVASLYDYGSVQNSAEVTLAGSLEVFGQKQKVTAGFNRVDAGGGRRTIYRSPIAHSTADPYIPYPGGPAGIPGVNVFDFDPYDPRYAEPRGALVERIERERGDTQSGVFLNLQLTAFDRLHLTTGVRYSWYETRTVTDSVCTITTGGCAGKRVGDVGGTPTIATYKDKELSWPPAYSLAYDATENVSVFGSYNDIYRSNGQNLDADLNPVHPTTGSNVELGVKWQGRGGRLDTSLSLYRTEQKGFVSADPSRSVVVNGVRYFADNFGNLYLNSTAGVLPDGQYRCCYINRTDQTRLSQGVDFEMTGEVLPQWQMSMGYTWNKNEQKGEFYVDLYGEDGQPLVSQAPQHLLKLWSSYQFRRNRWLNPLTIAGGFSAQSSAFGAGNACLDYGPPNPGTGISACRVSAPYEYTLPAHIVGSARADYKLNDSWAIAFNVDNLADKRYYRTMGTSESRNWYGTPRSFTLSLRGRF